MRLRDVYQDRDRASQDYNQTSAYTGVFANSATAIDTELYVTIPGIDEGVHQHGPVMWAPRTDILGLTVLPDAGDPCTVIQTEDGDYFVATWQSILNDPEPGDGGVSDHGLLTGLNDDDHPQYHNDARGDARYWPLTTDLATQAELNSHASDTNMHPTDYARESDVLFAQDMAIEAQKEAIDLDASMQRQLDYELEQKSDYLHNHDDSYYTKGAMDAALSAYLTTAAAASLYLPLAGGTLSGNLVIDRNGTASTASLTIDTDGGQEAKVTLKKDGNEQFSILLGASSNDLRFWNNVAGAYALSIVDTTNVAEFTNTPLVGVNTMWHAGNDGHESGLDADTLDGLHATDFAVAGSIAPNDGLWSEVFFSQEMALDAQKEAIDLDALMEKKTELELSLKADFDHNHDREYAMKQACGMYQGNAQTLGVSGSLQKVTTDTVRFDDNFGYGTQANTGSARIDIKRPGRYLVCANVAIANTSLVVAAIFVNGTQFAADRGDDTSAGTKYKSCSRIITLAAGDFLELYAFSNHATGTLTVGANNLEVFYLGPS